MLKGLLDKLPRMPQFPGDCPLGHPVNKMLPTSQFVMLQRIHTPSLPLRFGITAPKRKDRTQSRWSPFSCLESGAIPLDNNASEQTVKNPVMGKKAWLSCGSPAGGNAAAVFYTLTATCRRLKIDPYAYLKDVFERLPLCDPEYPASLTPCFPTIGQRLILRVKSGRVSPSRTTRPLANALFVLAVARPFHAPINNAADLSHRPQSSQNCRHRQYAADAALTHVATRAPPPLTDRQSALERSAP